MDSKRRIRRALWRHLGTPAAIYGLIVYASLIAATAVHAGPDDNAADVLIFSGVTLVVFWAAHLFANALAHHGVDHGEVITLRMSFAHGSAESLGMLESAIVPTIPLLLGIVGVLDFRESVLWALIAATVMLSVLGYVAFSIRHARIRFRLAGAAGTALFGLILIILESSLH